MGLGEGWFGLGTARPQFTLPVSGKLADVGQLLRRGKQLRLNH